MRFEIFQGVNKEYYFRIVSNNNQVVAMSEGYTQKQSAIKTISSIIQSIAQTYAKAEKVKIIDKTKEKGGN